MLCCLKGRGRLPRHARLEGNTYVVRSSQARGNEDSAKKVSQKSGADHQEETETEDESGEELSEAAEDDNLASGKGAVRAPDPRRVSASHQPASAVTKTHVCAQVCDVPKGDNVVSGAPIVVRGCGKEQPEARSGNSDRVGYECGNGCEGDDAIPSHFCSDCKL